MMSEFNSENNHLYIKAQEICQKIEQIEKNSDFKSRISIIERNKKEIKKKFFINLNHYNDIYSSSLIYKNAAIKKLTDEKNRIKENNKMELSVFIDALNKLKKYIQNKTGFTDKQIFVEPQFHSTGMYDFDVFVFDEAGYQNKCNEYDEKIQFVKDEFIAKVVDYYNELENVVFSYFKKRNNSYTCKFNSFNYENKNSDKLKEQIDELNVFNFMSNCNVKCLMFKDFQKL